MYIGEFPYSPSRGKWQIEDSIEDVLFSRGKLCTVLSIYAANQRHYMLSTKRIVMSMASDENVS